MARSKVVDRAAQGLWFLIGILRCLRTFFALWDLSLVSFSLQLLLRCICFCASPWSCAKMT
jgi:hypothetical protein